MKPYIFGARNGIYIIDLQQTVKLYQKAYNFVKEVVSKGGRIIFIGTKRQSQAAIEEEAKRCEMFYVNHRWLGGTLTNYKTIKISIDKLKKLDAKKEEGAYEGLTKKEVVKLERERIKLERYLGGLKKMNGIPEAVFVVDTKKEKIAINEAQKLGLPVVAVVDTNCDPDGIDYIIPGNDDAIRAIRLFSSGIADACLEGKKRLEETIRAEEEGGDEEEVVEDKVEVKKEEEEEKKEIQAQNSEDKKPNIKQA